MTVAVCFKCGAMKHGAFKACPKCNRRPQSEDDMASSLAFTDHYYSEDDLARIGADIANGNFPKFDPATWNKLIGSVRKIAPMLNAQGGSAATRQRHASATPAAKTGGSGCLIVLILVLSTIGAMATIVM